MTNVRVLNAVELNTLVEQTNALLGGFNDVLVRLQNEDIAITANVAGAIGSMSAIQTTLAGAQVFLNTQR